MCPDRINFNRTSNTGNIYSSAKVSNELYTKMQEQQQDLDDCIYSVACNNRIEPRDVRDSFKLEFRADACDVYNELQECAIEDGESNEL